jgi:drug/metabolite transporter (DMT)-like permease
MIGIALGLASAICFSSAAICYKIGQRTQVKDNGLWLSNGVNVVILGALAMFQTWPAWSLPGFVALIAGGIVGAYAGRSSNLKAVRLIGPSRANAFLTANPIVAAIGGWFFLDERLGVQEFMGGALVILGLLWLILSRSSPASEANAPPTKGYLWAIAAPVFFGSAFVVRKWGLELFPGAVIGAFIGAVAAFVVVTALDLRGGKLVTTVKANFKPFAWWYLAAGIFTTLALLSQFNAFDYLPAWVVGILQGTQGMFTLLLGWIFLRQEERIDRTLIGSILLVMVGVVLIGLEI